jgi:hypothetical protein
MSQQAVQDRTVIAAQATLRKALERQWRAWSALITEFEGERQATAQADDPEAALFAAPAPSKANLPLATRKQLLAVFDARLQTTQAEAEVAARQQRQPPPDAEAVRQQLITHIGRELRGAQHPKGLALIYWSGKLVPFDHRSLQRATAATDYLAAGLGQRAASPMQTALFIGGGVAGILVVLWVAMNVLFGASGPAPTASVAEAQVGDATITRWDVQGAGGVPGLRVDPARVSYPLVICAPEAQATALTGATVTLTGTANLRQYTLGASGADLRVVACERPERDLARGTLAEAMTTLPAPDGRVRDVWVRGPAADPQHIPADRMEVTVLADPTIGEASLVLADGTTLSPSARTPSPAGLALVYLAPLALVPQAAGLHAQVPDGGLPQISPVLLPAPEERLRELARVLTVSDPRVVRQGATVQLTLTVRARGARGAALGLFPGDIHASAGTTVVLATWAPQTLPGDGSPQQLIITLPASDTPLTVAVGTWQATIAP